MQGTGCGLTRKPFLVVLQPLLLLLPFSLTHSKCCKAQNSIDPSIDVEYNKSNSIWNHAATQASASASGGSSATEKGRAAHRHAVRGMMIHPSAPVSRIFSPETRSARPTASTASDALAVGIRNTLTSSPGLTQPSRNTRA